MPNWTYNSITITGDANSVKKVRKLLKDESEFDFNKLIPMPKGLLEESESRANLVLPDWYTWCVEHWGTKWNACHVELEIINETQIRYSFDTAWSAPYPAAMELKSRCADLGLDIAWTAEDEFESEVYHVLK